MEQCHCFCVLFIFHSSFDSLQFVPFLCFSLFSEFCLYGFFFIIICPCLKILFISFAAHLDQGCLAEEILYLDGTLLDKIKKDSTLNIQVRHVHYCLSGG